MSRISLGYFIIAGLLFWGIPGALVAGPVAILYTFLAELPLWWICRRNTPRPSPTPNRLSSTACTLLASFSLIYVGLDALFGRQMLQYNLFVSRGAGLDRVVQGIPENASKGGGVADLLGYIFALLPFGLIDATKNTSRIGRWILWAVALLVLFYDTSSGRGPVMLAVLAIVAGRTSDLRRILMATVLALAVFSVASALRGDSAHAGAPFLIGVVAPFTNLAMLVNANCGSATPISFIAEFLKKFIPAFLIDKTVFSFNLEMSLCINPTDLNLTNGVSVFTWLGEIFYYKPSWLTALLAGVILGFLAREVDRRLVKHQMYSARLFAGLYCIDLPRSRTQDIFTFLIAQLVFLIFIWPHLCRLPRTLYRYLMPIRTADTTTDSPRESV